jgi:hypothetical protein
LALSFIFTDDLTPRGRRFLIDAEIKGARASKMKTPGPGSSAGRELSVSASFPDALK